MIVAVLALAAALVAARPAAAPKPRTVNLADNYYVPAKLKVARAPRSRGAGPTRRATSTTSSSRRGRRASKKFHSQPASAGYDFKRKLGKPGRYKIVCTLHEEMKMTITVAASRPHAGVRSRSWPG